MDIQLQELIDKIKRDGIAAASEEAGKLKSQAEIEAQRILDAARKEADAIIDKGKADAERSERAAVAAVGQASRNLVLAFKSEIQAILDKLIAQGTAAAYGEDALKAVLPDVIRGWTAAKEKDALDLILPEAQLNRVSGYFNEQLAGEIKKGLELKPDRNLSAGFKIAEKDGSAYYDFSAEAVAELFSAYLNPRLASALKDSVKGI